jgi:hypothetical protein
VTHFDGELTPEEILGADRVTGLGFGHRSQRQGQGGASVNLIRNSRLGRHVVEVNGRRPPVARERGLTADTDRLTPGPDRPAPDERVGTLATQESAADQESSRLGRDGPDTVRDELDR